MAKKKLTNTTYRAKFTADSAQPPAEYGLCRDEDPELFFPIGTSGPAILQTEQAKAVCRRCSVAEDCLTWALETGQDDGVWGGLSADERRAVKRSGNYPRTAAHAGTLATGSTLTNEAAAMPAGGTPLATQIVTETPLPATPHIPRHYRA